MEQGATPGPTGSVGGAGLPAQGFFLPEAPAEPPQSPRRKPGCGILLHSEVKTKQNKTISAGNPGDQKQKDWIRRPQEGGMGR